MRLGLLLRPVELRREIETFRIGLSTRAFVLWLVVSYIALNGLLIAAHRLGAFEGVSEWAVIAAVFATGNSVLLGMFVAFMFPHLPLTLYVWLCDLFASSYFATWWKEPDCEEDSCPGHAVVAKTRGGRQYYQNRASNLFDLGPRELEEGNHPIVCKDLESAKDEAAARNHALSVQRKAVAGSILIAVGIGLEVAGFNIGILT